MKNNFSDIIKLIHQQQIKITHIHIADSFDGAMNRNGNSNPYIMHKHCTRRICHHLRDGKLYTCPDACYMDYFNTYFQQEIPKDSSINIYKNNGKDLEIYVTTYKDMCRYCTPKYRTFEWTQSKNIINEWDGKI